MAIEAIASVREAPPLLSGLDTKFHSKAMQAAEAAFAKDLISANNEICNTFIDAQAVLGVADTATQEWVDAAKLTDIQRKEEAAQSARQMFEESLATS